MRGWGGEQAICWQPAFPSCVMLCSLRLPLPSPAHSRLVSLRHDARSRTHVCTFQNMNQHVRSIFVSELHSLCCVCPYPALVFVSAPACAPVPVLVCLSVYVSLSVGKLSIAQRLTGLMGSAFSSKKSKIEGGPWNPKPQYLNPNLTRPSSLGPSIPSRTNPPTPPQPKPSY
jgi:hypothetical protein